jgi:DNA-3-methyladenine glycosylase I
MNVVKGTDGRFLCRWTGIKEEFIDYHDKEWGFPVTDDIRLFEKICLEGFQSGLCWRTILAKRENFRRAFVGFDFTKIAKFTDVDVEMLMQDEGTVRHRGKIEAVINNAARAIELVQEMGSLSAYFWSFEKGEGKDEIPQTRSTSETSVTLSKDLKKRGWKFVGPTTVYAFMQAMGMINDHVEDCYIRPLVTAARQS